MKVFLPCSDGAEFLLITATPHVKGFACGTAFMPEI